MWQPDYSEQIEAARHVLCQPVHNEVRAAIKQRMDDWVMFANGCRRRAHEYRRWALEYETAGNLTRYRQYRAEANRSWRSAKQALADARLQRSFL